MADPGADATALAARLEGVFRAIASKRMHDVPILNPALEVEAVGMRPWRGHPASQAFFEGGSWGAMVAT